MKFLLRSSNMQSIKIPREKRQNGVMIVNFTVNLTGFRENAFPPLRPCAGATAIFEGKMAENLPELMKDIKIHIQGESLSGLAVWRLPLAQGAIVESWDRVPRWAPGMELASPSSCVSASLSL